MPKKEADLAAIPADVLERYAAGELTTADVARLCRTTKGTALRQLRRAGFDTSSSTRRCMRSAYRRGVPNLHAEAVRLYQAGLSLHEVGARVGLTREAVRMVLARAGVPRRPPGKRTPASAAK